MTSDTFTLAAVPWQWAERMARQDRWRSFLHVAPRARQAESASEHASDCLRASASVCNLLGWKIFLLPGNIP